ncbi:MAG: hypothetical protein AAF487_00040 [Bacteroidota bacterium]
MPKYQAFYNQPCRFKLRSGKEVYGVIWPDEQDILFASLETYKVLAQERESEKLKSRLSLISEDDIIGIEVIPAIAS